MKRTTIIVLLALFLFFTAKAISVFANKAQTEDDRFVCYIVDPKSQDVRLYWKDDKNENFTTIQNLKTWLYKNKRNLVFAMNGGMYKPDYSPQGLFIENKAVLSPLDTSTGNGNFYLKPNGVFYITEGNEAVICSTQKFSNNGLIKYATQSGPMLVIDGEIHPAFKGGSTNLNIRNGVGVLPGNKIVFTMSKSAINFYDFAKYFKSLGCRNALYLDGFISRTYLPEKQWIQTDGNFGVIIGVTNAR